MASYYKNVKTVSYKHYCKIFSSNYNIGFCRPSQDICDTCSSLDNVIKEGKKKGKDIDRFQQKKDLHVAKAKVAYAALKAAKKKKLRTNKDWKFICMDLQQTQLCPKLAVGSAYYKRKLSLHNFCVHDLPFQESYMYVWEENTASRGSVEIFSCLRKWLEDNVLTTPNYPRNLRIFADNCGGQNKNINITLALLREIHLKNFDRIELCYLVPGHSYMACDRSFGHVAKNLEAQTSIMSPDIYCSYIASARTTKDYPLYRMKGEEFMDIDIFSVKGKDRVILRRAVKDKAFQTAAQIIVTHEYPQGYILKSDYNIPDAEGEYCYVVPPKTKKELFNLSNVSLEPKYKQDRQLNSNKLKDLQSMKVFLADQGEWITDLLKRQNELYGTYVAAKSGDQEDLDAALEEYQDNTVMDEVLEIPNGPVVDSQNQVNEADHSDEDIQEPNDLDYDYNGDFKDFEYDNCVRYHFRSRKK